MTEIKKYLESKYGYPVRTAEFQMRESPTVRIYKWAEEQTCEGVTMYATDGARFFNGPGKHKCEFFIGLTPEVDSIAEALAETAVKGIGNNQMPSSGDTLTLTFDLWENAGARSFLFTDGDEIVPPTALSDGTHVKFIKLVPLFESELRFKKKFCEHALWRKFEALDVPYWDSRRGPAL